MKTALDGADRCGVHGDPGTCAALHLVNVIATRALWDGQLCLLFFRCAGVQVAEAPRARELRHCGDGSHEGLQLRTRIPETLGRAVA